MATTPTPADLPRKHKKAQCPAWVDASSFGFSPESDGIENMEALQRAVDEGGTILITRPGIYNIAGTVYIGSHTTLCFSQGVSLRKVAPQGAFTHVFLNRGALSGTTDYNIVIEGLHLIVNGIDVRSDTIGGLRGQIAFLHIKDLRIEHFRCFDLCKQQFAIHICTFEDIQLNDLVIKGAKDGVHLGRGRRFAITNGIFQTHDDAIALNAHDYASSNPELGWIENGIIQNCHDLPKENGKSTGFFCRILAGAWTDWQAGMEVQQSDSVVSEGRLYRVSGEPDGSIHTSLTRPTHLTGYQVLDGIKWRMVQDEDIHMAGVRNVVFRDIFLENPRVGFSVHFDRDAYSRSYYPGAPIPVQEQLLFDNVRVLHSEPAWFLQIGTPLDVLTIVHSSFGASGIRLKQVPELPPGLKTVINLVGCTFRQCGEMELLSNQSPGREIRLQTTACVAVSPGFRASVHSEGAISVNSDLPGLTDFSKASAEG